MTNKQLLILAASIGAWADANFKVHDPALGVLEETGEIAHCILKHKQGIRGFDDPVKFKAELTDGIADAAIYTLHSAYLTSAKLETFEEYGISGREALAFAAAGAYRLVLDHRTDILGAEVHSSILVHLAMLAKCHDIDFDATVQATWEKVSKRNWKDNPKDAAKIAESSS